MESHKRILGILYIVSGLIQLMVLAGVSLFITTLFPWIASEAGDEGWILELIGKFIPIILWSIILLFSVPTIIAGIGLLQNKSWALMLALIMGCFKLFSFPIGTALGIYAIWVYAESNKPAPTA
ncbi:MAG: hypothetical protein MUE95_09530 [Cyclobacteriaceae bacterium]|jgi:hypothetical protein|nr:hypothetical protein [Cyclobacteriaceae bacterium]